jgi:hypothetical protein
VLHTAGEGGITVKEITHLGWVEWLTSANPATQEAEIGVSPFEANLGKKLARPNLNQQAGCGGALL